MIHIYIIIIKIKNPFLQKIIGIRDYHKESKLDWEKSHIFFSYVESKGERHGTRRGTVKKTLKIKDKRDY